MLNFVIIAIALLFAAYLAFAPKLVTSSDWQATVTPLASIMGSGFLVSAPLLSGVVGNLAVFCMGILLFLAYLVGSAIRFNIRYFEPIENDGKGLIQNIATLSRFVLAGAYFISISYYLQLLGAFLLNAFGVNNTVISHVITSSLLLIICGIGIWKGLAQLGVVEKYAVSLNLGMIAALLVALAVYNAQLLLTGNWALPAISSDIDFNDMRVLLGLLIVVQGFEASRYLGDEFPAEQRIATMRKAQIISTVIYLVFLALVTVLFQTGIGSDVTAIVKMTKPVAVVLPLLLSVAAIGSQFSAAVADTEGAGGLIEDISARKLTMRYAYLLILAATLALTWETNVNVIIAYASRAFALYYALQCYVAFLVVRKQQDLSQRSVKLILFPALSVICLLVAILGVPSG